MEIGKRERKGRIMELFCLHTSLTECSAKWNSCHSPLHILSGWCSNRINLEVTWQTAVTIIPLLFYHIFISKSNYHSVSRLCCLLNIIIFKMYFLATIFALYFIDPGLEFGRCPLQSLKRISAHFHYWHCQQNIAIICKFVILFRTK